MNLDRKSHLAFVLRTAQALVRCRLNLLAIDCDGIGQSTIEVAPDDWDAAVKLLNGDSRKVKDELMGQLRRFECPMGELSLIAWKDLTPTQPEEDYS